MLRLATLGLVIASTSALAQPNSDSPLAEAEALAKKNDFVGAAAQFKLAYARDPRPELVCNVGVAYYKAKQLARAQLFLSRCLERGTALEAKFVDNVRAVLKAVETSLRQGEFTPVDIVVEPAGATITVDGEDFIGSRLVWLPSGRQSVHATAEGYAEQTIEVDATGHDPKPIKITLERTPAPVVPVEQPTPPPPVVVTPPPPPPRATPVRTEHASFALPIATTAVTVVAATVVVVAYGRAHDAAGNAQFAVSPGVYQSDVDRTNRWNTLMGASAAVALIGAGASGYLWFRATHATAPVEVSPTSGGVAFRFSARW